MAEGKVESLSPAEIDRRAVERYNRLLKQSVERNKRLEQHYEWRGNKLPPFSIEPVPHERERLGEGGMTAEQRALRAQWVKDQELAPNEPRYIAELKPRNPFRRALAVPWDIFFNVLKPMLGQEATTALRFSVPRVALILFGSYVFYYNYKYHPNDWTTPSGWYSYSSKGQILPGDPYYPKGPEKPDSMWYDRGFSKRTVLLDVTKTSATSD